MTNHRADVPDLQPLWREINKRRTFVLAAGAIGLVAGAIAALAPSRYAGSQALVIRQRSEPGETALGAFAHSDDRKAVQAAVAALALHEEVIADSLAEIGPPRGAPSGWPTAEDVETARKQVELRPPSGSDYGQTDIFYLRAEAVGRSRAAAFAESLARGVQARYQTVRRDQAEGMIRELEAAAAAAESEVRRFAERAGAIEAQVGPDLAELRLLDATSGGISDLRQNLMVIEAEQRDAERNARLMRELRDLLATTHDARATLIATPSDLLNLQPGLRRLKEGLIDAQLRTAALRGSRSERHPDVRAAVAEEARSDERLQAEVEVALAGLNIDLELAEGRIDHLKRRIADSHDRLAKIGALRSEYHGLTTSLQDQSEHLQHVRRELGDLRGAVASARQAPLLQLIDAPSVGLHPVGLSRKATIGGGLFGGFACGIAWVLLITPASRPAPTSQAASGRTASRQAGWERRAATSPAAEPTPATRPAGGPITLAGESAFPQPWASEGIAT